MLRASMMGNFNPSQVPPPSPPSPLSPRPPFQTFGFLTSAQGERLGAEGMVMPGLPGVKIQVIDEEQVDKDVKKLIGDRSLEVISCSEAFIG